MNEVQEIVERDLCSPSQLNLRFHCPASAQLQTKLITAGFKDKSEAADRGTRLHAIMEKYGRDKIPVTAHDEKGDDLEALLYCAEMVEEIIADIADQNPVRQFEIQIDLSELGISGGIHGCRIDQVILLPGVGVIFIDYKFGFKWVTDPEFNWQLRAYAWGVHKKFGGDVQAIILQPSSDEERRFLTHTFHENEFDEIGRQIKEVVEKTKSLDADLCRGRHCTKLFCQNKVACPLWIEAALAVPYPHTIASFILQCSPEERQNILNELKRAQSWINKARGTIEAMAINGDIEIRGHKVVHAEEWQWIDENTAYEAAKTFLINKGKPERIADLYEPAHLKSRSSIQKIIGQAKDAKIFLKMNTKKVEIEGKFKLEQIEDDVDSIKIRDI